MPPIKEISIIDNGILTIEVKFVQFPQIGTLANSKTRLKKDKILLSLLKIGNLIRQPSFTGNN